MTVPDPPAEVVDALHTAADPQTAAFLAGYFKTGPGEYGFGDRFIGVKVPVIRSIVKPYARVPFHVDAWLPLLRSEIHEHRLATLLAMTYRFPRADPREQTRIYRCYLDNTDSINNWDLVDLSCRAVVGAYLFDRDRTVLDRLARSESLWERRIAIISTHEFIRRGETEDTYRIALILIHDSHDLIHKAVGWSLREAGKRVSRAELLEFLDHHAAELPRTTLRYAIEHLAPDQRRHYRGLRSARTTS
jgi:3-methyladenine DNA glycosylase AlkD